MKTIQELTTLIEELEKRISKLSTAQNITSQLLAIKEYIADVQNYLQELNISFDNHVKNCTDYSTDISNINSDIDTINNNINEIIDTLDSLTGVNAEQITDITNNLNSLTSKVNNFLGNNTTTLNSLVNDISEIQTDLGSCQDDIADINTEISAINSSIGEQNTTITNIQTAQTNLSTTQSNQASTISANSSDITALKTRVSATENTNNNQTTDLISLKTRMTTCENNVNALTGGVDVGEIDNRIDSLEAESGPTCAHETYNFHNATPSNKTLYTRVYYYSCSKDALLYQRIKLSYNSTGTGTLTINVYEEQVATGKTIVVDLSKNPYEYEFSRQFLPKLCGQNIQLKVIATTEITYKTMDLWLFGKNVIIYNSDQDVKALCFNNKIYITKYEENEIKFGLFDANAEIDLNNLPNSYPYSDAMGCIRYAIFAPYAHNETREVLYSDYYERALLTERLDTNKNTFFLADQETTSTNFITNVNNITGGEIISGTLNLITQMGLVNGTLAIANNLGSTTNFIKLHERASCKWIYASQQISNIQSSTTVPYTIYDLSAVGFGDNGKAYLLARKGPDYFINLDKNGISASAYYLNTVKHMHIYLNYLKDTYLFNTQPHPTSGMSIVISKTILYDCTFVYELCDGRLIKKTSSGWVISDPPSASDAVEASTISINVI